MNVRPRSAHPNVLETVIGYAEPTPSVQAATPIRARPPARFGPAALLLGAVLIASLAAFVRPVTDGDFWWHVRTGRWIVEHGRLPGRDLFTYTAFDHRWVDSEYLTEVVMWLVRSRLGLAGVSVAFGAVAWSGFLLVALSARPRRQPYVLVGLALGLAALAGYPVWGARPQTVTFALASLELLWLRGYLERSSSTGGPLPRLRRVLPRLRGGESIPRLRRVLPRLRGGESIFWLPLVMALWGNLHGGWPVGFLFLAIAMVCCLLRWLSDRTNIEDLRRTRVLALVGAASAAAVLINPNGAAVYAYPVQTLTSAAQRGLIAEWQSPDFHLAALRAFEVMLLLVVTGVALGKSSLFDVLLVLAGIALALESARHIALFVAAATPVLVTTWSDIWRRLAVPRFLPIAPPRRWLSAVTLAVLALVALGVGLRTADGLARQPTFTSQTVPVGAADWLAAHPEVGTRMFNQYSWGGYLADRFYPNPNRRVFIFSEGVLMGDDLLLDYRRVAVVAPGWRDVLNRAGVDYVVFDSGSSLNEMLAAQPNWRLVYRDGTAVIYLRSA
ncbi:MAG TPA: hypothetical protein VKI99_13175 [Candidatus Dormibacteraeota bacterium]|nr:hypothetical protein [Candidatus Dormibacteraeota bacterium]